jgi:hypothetical protein
MEVVICSARELSSDDQPLGRIRVMFHLLHEQMSRDIRLARVVRTAVKPVVIEDVNRYALLGEEIQELRVHRDLTEKEKLGDVLDRDDPPPGRRGGGPFIPSVRRG